MSQFLRLLTDSDKEAALTEICARARSGEADARLFEVFPEAFDAVPGKPFSYWVSDAIRSTFQSFPAFESGDRAVRQGLATADDFRFVRAVWEINQLNTKWYGLAKGGKFSKYYADLTVSVNWANNGHEIKAWADPLYGNSGWSRILKSTDYYFRPGLSWPLRGITFSSQAVPRGCVFSVAGKMAFAPLDSLEVWLAIFNSLPFDYLVRLFAGKVGGVQYEVGLIGGIPAPIIDESQRKKLAWLARQGWRRQRELASIEEKSAAFILPAALRSRAGGFNAKVIANQLAGIQTEINDIAFLVYRFSESDKRLAMGGASVLSDEAESTSDYSDESDDEPDATEADALLSWAVGVAFGRFDWRLATGERAAPPEPEPFDSLPALSPGMLPVGAAPFHTHAGILVDDPSHAHDLARLVDDVLVRVNQPVPDDLRRWLQREFFAFHLQRYSKSRRKAPIYWPLATASGSYTLWLYYPSLSSQTLYSAINDFVEPKLAQVAGDGAALRNKGAARSRDEEKRFETLEAFELELIELRDTLLKIAPTFKPDHDDGVQITAAPLWPLFRHKPWQKVLKDTWAKLEKGDYDWAHLAMSYWPNRVREKCKTDKSLAIAHGLESLYIEPPPKPTAKRGRKPKEA